jgi:hypothetical protein
MQAAESLQIRQNLLPVIAVTVKCHFYQRYDAHGDVPLGMVNRKFICDIPT